MTAVAIALLIIVQALSAQTDEIAQIRNYYNSVEEHLDDEHGLYRTEISINTEDGVYPALGHYQEKITFYWGSAAGHSWLVLVIWSGEFAAHREYGEVLFYEPEDIWSGDTGELAFEFVSSHNSDDVLTESRWWYSGGKLIQSMGRTNYPDEMIEFTPDILGEYDYAHNPAELMELFNTIH